MPKTKVRHCIQNIKIAWYKKEHSENKTELLEIKSTIVEILKIYINTKVVEERFEETSPKVVQRQTEMEIRENT